MGPHPVASYDTQGDAKDLFLPRSLQGPADLKQSTYQTEVLQKLQNF
jgi:hypothetical protein